MRTESLRLAAAGALLLLAPSAALAAFGGRVVEVRAASGHVRATLELKDAFGRDQRTLLERGSALHVRIEAGVWEDRAVWDRVVEAPRVTVFRVIQQPGGAALAVIDSGGGTVIYKPYPNPLTLAVDLCELARLSASARYYLDGIVTIGTLSDEERDEANEAVFGRDEGSAGLKSVGRLLLNTVLQVSDYVRSVSSDIRSGKFTAKELTQRR